MDDNRRHAPATGRNREPILEVLRRVLPTDGLVLEVASGTGEHAVAFGAALPRLIFQPSDPDPAARRSIAAWIEQAGLPNVRPPIELDATLSSWPIERADAVLCINMVHIAPWEACLGLLAGAAAILPAGAPLVTYGPYMIDGRHTAASNERFDESLRASDPRHGVRDLGEIARAALERGLRLEERVPMPANNFTAVFRREPPDRPIAATHRR
jgi:hypothetical protein